jgi:hypothetical protein
MAKTRVYQLVMIQNKLEIDYMVFISNKPMELHQFEHWLKHLSLPQWSISEVNMISYWDYLKIEFEYITFEINN